MKKVLAWIAGSLVVLTLSAWILGNNYSRHYFFPGSKVNGYEVGGMDAASAEKVLNGTAPAITVVQRDAETLEERSEEIELKDVGYWANYDTQSLIDAQPHAAWFTLLQKPLDVSLEKQSFTVDAGLLQEAVSNLYCMQEENQVAPSDAYIEGDSGNRALILPADDGAEIIPELAQLMVQNAITREAPSVDLTEDCYAKAEITVEDQILQSRVKMLESIYNKTITVNLYDDVTAQIGKEDLKKIISIQDDNSYKINEQALTAAVEKLQEAYPTVTQRRGFLSSRGDMVAVGVSSDVYEYTFDVKGTAEAIREVLLLFGDQSAIASWLRPDGKPGLTVSEFGPGYEADGCYIEISIDDQHLWYYEHGELILDTDVVTGEKYVNDTPCGVFDYPNMSQHNTLQGGAQSDYWIGFVGGQYGIHDAWRWRSEYGGDIYLWDGSHGCVNTPIDAMEELYWKYDIEKYIPVIVYEVSEGR